MSSLSSAAEAVVIGLAASGETSAFDELVRRKQSGVRSLMRYLSHDAALAEDLAQQVFVEMWKSLPRLESPRAFHGWLKRIAVNVWLQHARKKDIFSSRRTDPLDEFEEQGVHDAPNRGAVRASARDRAERSVHGRRVAAGSQEPPGRKSADGRRRAVSRGRDRRRALLGALDTA
jgi:RNA polymerase sigma factor (sigma-70 family)